VLAIEIRRTALDSVGLCREILTRGANEAAGCSYRDCGRRGYQGKTAAGRDFDFMTELRLMEASQDAHRDYVHQLRVLPHFCCRRRFLV
jgi:hypothetical protein